MTVGWPAGSCPAPTSRLEYALWEALHVPGQPDLSCANAAVGYQRTPQSLQTPVDAFGELGDQIMNARAEVLITSMEWRSGPGTPGWSVAQALSELYRRVQRSPGTYPQGMSVRLLLGGYPEFADPDGLRLAQAVVRDLRQLNVPLNDPGVGWTLSVLNFRYFPHSHVKLHVIDGEDLSVAGFNFSARHLPVARPGGNALHDLALRVRGPVAQAGVAAFDDLWRHSWELQCPPQVEVTRVAADCRRAPATEPQHPPAARAAVPAGGARVFLLYRRPGGVDFADRAHLALLKGARGSIDLMQSDFSGAPLCWLAFLSPALCPVEVQPAYFGAVLSALERGVRVRLLLVDYGEGATPNRSGVATLRRELRRRGIEDRFEARYTTFPMHTKALVVDREMVVAGSMNFHFSAWGPWGLAEAALATSDAGAVAAQMASFGEAWRTSSRPVPPEWWLDRVPVGAP